MNPADPARLGPYRLLARLGAGAMGEVWKAAGDEGVVAVKVFHPHLTDRKGFLKRAQREADAGREVVNDHVVRTLDFDLAVVNGRPTFFLVLEYVEGRTLRQLLDELGPLPEPFVREIARQAAHGLAAIHARRIVHRDVKPENVLITTDRRVRLMDLGIAKALDATTELTREGQFAGSLLYASPEQFDAKDVGPAADLYALGATLYVLATGENPFRRESAAATVRAHLHERPPPASATRPDLSPFFVDLVATLLEKRPTDRFESATALASALEQGERSAWWRGRASSANATAPTVPVRRETAIVGRETDVAAAIAAWTDALETRGGLLFVEGEAGIGKSRLVAEIVDRAVADGAHVLYGSYPPAGEGSALSDAILSRFGAEGLERSLAPFLSTRRAVAPELAASMRPGAAAGLDPDARAAALADLAAGLSADRPTLWVVEDVHFAPASDRAAIEAVAETAAGRRLLVVATARPSIDATLRAALAATAGFVPLSLARLSRDDVARLLAAALHGDALAGRLGETIARKSDGVPFFVLEILRALEDAQVVVTRPDGTYALTGDPDAVTVPSTIKTLVTRRLADLSEDERAVADVGAVMGFEFDPDLVARALGKPRLEVLERLAFLEHRTGLVRGTEAGARFDHHQLQELLEEAIPQAQRAAHHAALAAARVAQRGMDPETAGDATPGEDALFVVRHHLVGSRPADAAPWVHVASAWLAARGRHDEVIELARVLDRDDLPGDPVPARRRAEIRARAATALSALGREDEAEIEQRRSDDDATQSGELAALVGVALKRMARANDEGRYQDEVDSARTLVAASAAAGKRRNETHGRIHLAAGLAGLGRYVEALAEAETALAVSEEKGWLIKASFARTEAGHALLALGRAEEATEAYAKARDDAIAIGYRPNEAWALTYEGVALAHQGRLAESATRLAEGRGLSRALALRVAHATAAASMAALALRLGDTAGAIASANEALGAMPRRGNEDIGSTATRIRAEARALAGDAAGAVRDARDAREVAARSRRPTEEALALATAATLAFARGDHPAALESSAAAMDAASRSPHPRARVAALVARALVEPEAEGVVVAARAALDEAGLALAADVRMEGRLVVGIASGRREDLAEARRLLFHLLSHASPERRVAMRTLVPAHRRILEATAI